MPNKVVKRGGKFRVIDANTGKVTKNSAGTAVDGGDGGGHSSASKARSQAAAINTSQAGKSKRSRR